MTRALKTSTKFQLRDDPHSECWTSAWPHMGAQWRIIAAILCLLLLAFSVQAESRGIQLLRDRVDVLELNYAAAQNNDEKQENLRKLILARERLLSAVCMPRLSRDLEHKVIELSEKCSAEVSATLALMPNSYIATCARDGIDAPTCKLIAGKQMIDKGYRSRKSLNPHIQAGTGNSGARRLVSLEQLPDEAEKLARAFQEERSQVRLRELHSYFAQRLQTSCDDIEIDFETRNIAIETTQAPSTPEDEELRKLLEEHLRRSAARKPKSDDPQDESAAIDSSFVASFSGSGVTAEEEVPAKLPAKDTKELEKDEMIRVRKIPFNCLETLNELHLAFPSSALYECYMKGGLHPDCIEASREQKKIPETVSKSRKNKNEQTEATPVPESFSRF